MEQVELRLNELEIIILTWAKYSYEWRDDCSTHIFKTSHTFIVVAPAPHFNRMRR